MPGPFDSTQKRRKQTVHIWKQGVDDDIRISEWKETGWIKLHNEKCHNFYSSTNYTKNDQTKEDRMVRACNTWNAHKISAGTHAKRALGDLGTDGPPGQLMWKAFKRVYRVHGRTLVNRKWTIKGRKFLECLSDCRLLKIQTRDAVLTMCKIPDLPQLGFIFYRT